MTDPVPLLVSHLLSIVGFAMATVLIAVIVAQRRAPGTTLAWLLAIVLIPYIGVPLYLMFGGRKLRNRGDKARLVEPPVRGGNTVELYTTGETAFTEIVAALERAERSIRISTLILGDDEVGDAILDVLARKAKGGVEVRVLLDSLFKRRSDRRALSAFRAAGGRVAWFMPVLHVPFRRQLRANLRLHRKIIIVDGAVAIVGGMNLAREYMGPEPVKGRWRDLSASLRGPVVADLDAVFRADWQFAAHEQLEPSAPEPPETVEPAGDGARVQVVASGPDVSDDLIYDAFLTAVFAAKQRLWIATPYYVPDEALSRAIVLAVRRGVDVRIVVPRRSNHRTADYAGASYLRAVDAAGGRVCCFEPTMLHAKAILVDDTTAAIGSANLDMRSLFLNYEVALFSTSPAEVQRLAAWFDTLWPECGELAPASRGKMVLESVARLVGPLE